MYQRRRVNIIRNQYKPRDYIKVGNYNLVIDLDATVPDDSYLLIQGSEIGYVEPSRIRETYLKLADELIKSTHISRGYLESLFKKFKVRSRVIQSKSNIMLSDRPVIPGSSMKGAVRSRLEYKFNVVNGVSLSCYSVLSGRDIPLTFKRRHLKYWGREIDVNRNSCSALKGGYVCIVCDIFGAPGLVSRVYFENFYPENGVKLHDILINRVNFRVIPPGTHFKGKIYCKNFDLKDLALLLLGLEIFTRSPILIGRFKYRFNPKVGGKTYDDRFFGLLKLSIEDIESYPKWEYRDIDEVIKASYKIIQEMASKGYIDVNRGVL